MIFIQVSVPYPPSFVQRRWKQRLVQPNVPELFRQFRRQGQHGYKLNDYLSNLTNTITNFLFLDLTTYFFAENDLKEELFGSDRYHLSNNGAKMVGNILKEYVDEMGEFFSMCESSQ